MVNFFIENVCIVFTKMNETEHNTRNIKMQEVWHLLS